MVARENIVWVFFIWRLVGKYDLFIYLFIYLLKAYNPVNNRTGSIQ